MGQEIRVNARSRKALGSGSMRKLRSTGWLPGIIYGKDADNLPVEVERHDLEKMLRQHASEQLLVELTVDEEAPRRVLLSEIQRHPVSGDILHLDFRLVTATTQLHVTCPIELEGEPIGVTQQGGVLEHLMHEIEIICLPEDILEVITVDVSGLALGDRVTVGELPLDRTKHRLAMSEDVAVAAVAAPRVREEEEGEEAAEAAGEPELVGGKEEKEEKDAQESGS